MAKLKLPSRKAKKSDKKSKKIRLKLRKPTKAFFKSAGFLTSLMIILGLGGFIYSGQYWYKHTLTNTDKIFYGMLEKNLRTSSVTRTVDQPSSSRTEKQVIYLDFSPKTVVNTKSSIEQIGQDRQKSAVSTENIGTKDSDFIRYTNVEIPQASGDKTDYSKILNTWAKRTKQSTADGKPQFLNEATFTFMPFGNFSVSKKDEIIKKIKDKKVYKVHDTKVTYENGRLIMTGIADINPRQFVSVMQDYAKATGVGNLDQLDPSQYQDKNNFPVSFSVDVITRHLTKLVYPNGDRAETYDAYGVKRPIEVPTKYISVDELQSRLK